ncbi:hypothetical protein MMC12_003123 [Toensbergia leucococca]|nr:hypothetical protein [Toensbergia leucococca]
MLVDHHTSREDEPLLEPGQPTTSREYLPAELYGDNFNLDLTDYDDDIADSEGMGELTLVPCPNQRPSVSQDRLPRHTDSIFIAVKGACRGFGTPNARAAIGVYVAIWSAWNLSMRLNWSAPTRRKAELMACLAALKRAEIIKGGAMTGLSQVFVKTDSVYLHRGVTNGILEWRANGWLDDNGQPIMNGALFRLIEEASIRLDSMGVEFLICRIPRSRNQEANALANAALN